VLQGTRQLRELPVDSMQRREVSNCNNALTLAIRFIKDHNKNIIKTKSLL
jgi:hypothetical protein